ncbi:MAG: hypothetical protein ACREUY_01120 [Burkholderiales bacterium]
MAKLEQIDLDPHNDDTVNTDDTDTEYEILSTFRSAPDDNTYEMFIYRVVGANKLGIKEPLVFRGDAKTYLSNIHEILQEKGTGTYRIRVMKNGRFWKKWDESVEVSERPKEALPQRSELADFVAAIQRSNEALMERLLIKQSEPPRSNPFDDLEKLTTIIKNLTPEPPEYRQPQQSQTDLTQVFVKGVEFAEKIVGDKGGETGIWDIAKEFIRNLPAVAQLAQQRQPPKPPQIQPGPAPAPAAPVQTQIVDQQEAIREILQYLLTRAQRNSDIVTYGEWVLDNVEPDIVQLILFQPDPVSFGMTIEPRIASQRLWFERLIAELRQLVNMPHGHDDMEDDATRPDTETDLPNGNPGGSIRDGGHVADHVPAGKGWPKKSGHT